MVVNKDPMLAKRYEGIIKNAFRDDELFITEKLDGNRCLAWFDDDEKKWKFQSRNGKMKYNYDFDMADLPTNRVYDGEVISMQQYADSIALYDYLYYKSKKPKYTKMFNEASGQMNRKNPDMPFIYYIFDYIHEANNPYCYRRNQLDILAVELKSKSKNVRILPVIGHTDMGQADKYDMIHDTFEKVSSCGAEGIMINIGSANYQHVRTDALLKYKDVHTMDLKVIGVESGTGKYSGAVGSLVCQGMYNGLEVYCNVGSGLSDEQRWSWAEDESKILGRIIEVEYFDVSQRGALKGTNVMSLRFPRFNRIRYDKSDSNNI